MWGGLMCGRGQVWGGSCVERGHVWRGAITFAVNILCFKFPLSAELNQQIDSQEIYTYHLPPSPSILVVGPMFSGVSLSKFFHLEARFSTLLFDQGISTVNRIL